MGTVTSKSFKGRLRRMMLRLAGERLELLTALPNRQNGVGTSSRGSLTRPCRGHAKEQGQKAMRLKTYAAIVSMQPRLVVAGLLERLVS